jgi:hypothetical protein
LAIERMNTPGSRKWSVSLIRSPSRAPLLNGEDGSIEPDYRGPAGLRIDLADQLPALGIVVLHQRDPARERASISR